jgi:hypothetical protein
LAEQYASDSDDAGGMSNISSEIIHDESSKDSDDSLGMLSPRSRTIATVIRKGFKKIDGTLKVLGAEADARDFLVAQTLMQADEIEKQKHLRKVQEGNTSAQTTKANKAIRAEINARLEVASAKSKAVRERERRDKAEANNRSLLMANVNLSSSIKNISSVNQVFLRAGVLFWRRLSVSCSSQFGKKKKDMHTWGDLCIFSPQNIFLPTKPTDAAFMV